MAERARQPADAAPERWKRRAVEASRAQHRIEAPEAYMLPEDDLDEIAVAKRIAEERARCSP